MLVAIAMPNLIPVFTDIMPKRWGISKRSHLRALGENTAIAVAQSALAVTFLAHQAWLMSDAITRTLGRLYLTRRRLLEWTPAAQAGSTLSLDVRGVYRSMGGAVVLAAAAAALVIGVRPASWILAAPFVLLWALSPLVARWISLPPRARETSPLPPEEASVSA